MFELFDFFVAPIRDSQMAQMAILAVLLLILMDWLPATAVLPDRLIKAGGLWSS